MTEYLVTIVAANSVIGFSPNLVGTITMIGRKSDYIFKVVGSKVKVTWGRD